MSQSEEIERLRSLGLLEQTASGVEAVRVTVQLKLPIETRTRTALRDALLSRQQTIENVLVGFDASIVPDSLSVTGQFVEALVPLHRLGELAETMAMRTDVRMDVIIPRNPTLK